MGDVFLHHGRIDCDPLQALVGDRARGPSCLARLGQQPLHSLFADPLAPASQRGRVDRWTVLEEGLAGEVLVVGIFNPPGDDRLVRELEGMLEIHQPRDQSRRRRRAPLMRGKETHPFPLEEIPVDQRRELHQLMASVDHVDQPRAKEIILFGHAGMGLHRRPEIARFLPQAYKTLQIKANKTADSVPNQRGRGCSDRTNSPLAP